MLSFINLDHIVSVIFTSQMTSRSMEHPAFYTVMHIVTLDFTYFMHYKENIENSTQLFIYIYIYIKTYEGYVTLTYFSHYTD